MSPKAVSRMEATGESRGQARVRVAERAEELAGSIDQTLDSAEQAIQQKMYPEWKQPENLGGRQECGWPKGLKNWPGQLIRLWTQRSRRFSKRCIQNGSNRRISGAGKSAGGRK